MSSIFCIINKMIKAALFDLDGTLIDSESFYMKGMVNIAHNLGAINATEKDFYCVIGKTMDYTYEVFERIVNRDLSSWKDYYNNYFKDIDPLKFDELLFDDVKDTFIGLKEKGIKIAICSMSPIKYIEKFVNDCNLNEYVDYYVSGDEVEHTKPYPDIYLKALKDLNMNKDEVIVVEDADTGIEASLAAGIKVYARDDSKFNIDQSKAIEVFKDLRKLLKII